MTLVMEKFQHSFAKFNGIKNLGATAWPCHIQKLCYNEVCCKKMALYLIIGCRDITEILWKVMLTLKAPPVFFAADDNLKFCRFFKNNE